MKIWIKNFALVVGSLALATSPLLHANCPVPELPLLPHDKTVVDKVAEDKANPESQNPQTFSLNSQWDIFGTVTATREISESTDASEGDVISSYTWHNRYRVVIATAMKTLTGTYSEQQTSGEIATITNYSTVVSDCLGQPIAEIVEREKLQPEEKDGEEERTSTSFSILNPNGRTVVGILPRGMGMPIYDGHGPNEIRIYDGVHISGERVAGITREGIDRRYRHLHNDLLNVINYKRHIGIVAFPDELERPKTLATDSRVLVILGVLHSQLERIPPTSEESAEEAEE